MKIVFLFIASFLAAYNFSTEIDISVFNNLPRNAYTLKCNDENIIWEMGYKVKEVVKDSITFYAEKDINFKGPIREYIKLSVDGESHLVVLDRESTTAAGFIKWRTEGDDFTFSDTTILTTSFKEEDIKILFPYFRGELIISKIDSIDFIEELDQVHQFMGFNFIRDNSKENL